MSQEVGKFAHRVLMVSDENYLVQTLALISNLKANVKVPVEVYVILSGISRKIHDKISSYLSMKSSGEFNVVPIFLTKEDEWNLLSNLETNPKLYVTKATYLRLFFTTWTPKDTQSLLYLDSDILICSNVDDLITFLPELTVAAAPNPWSTEEINAVLGNEHKGLYFNAGVIKINVNRWRELNYDSKIASRITQRSTPYQYNDQDLLNIELVDDWEHLSSQYNFLVNDLRANLASRDKNHKILHFAGAKPWNESPLNQYVITYRHELWKIFLEIEEALFGA